MQLPDSGYTSEASLLTLPVGVEAGASIARRALECRWVALHAVFTALALHKWAAGVSWEWYEDRLVLLPVDFSPQAKGPSDSLPSDATGSLTFLHAPLLKA